MRGPDFLGVGQQKAGTTWLYDQLNMHPAFWMPPVKELHYLTGNFPHHKTMQEIERLDRPARKMEKWQARRVEERRRPIDDRDRAFFERVKAAAELPLTLETYGGLFEPARDLLTGDITPGYGAFTDARICELVDAFPRVRAIQIVREPVERAWSEICKSVRDGSLTPDQAVDEQAVRERLAQPSFARRAEGSRTASQWLATVGPQRYLTVLFDDLERDPAAALAQVLSFLGVAPSPSGIPPDFDRKADHAKLEMPAHIESLLARHYAAEAEASARMFGGAAAEWPTRHR